MLLLLQIYINSLIDLVLTDDDQHLSDTLVHSSPFGKGDHDVLTWKYLSSVNEDTTTVTEPPPVLLNVNKGDYITLNNLLVNINWKEEFDGLNLEEMVDRFYKLTKERINECVPKIKAKQNHIRKPPWMSKSAKKQIRKKKCAWERYKNNSNNWQKYLQYVKERNKACRLTRTAKRDYEKKIAAECKTNPKAFYRYANFKSKANKKVIRLKNKDGKICISGEDNANILNDYFSSVFTKEDDSPELILNSSTETLYEEINEPFDYHGPTIKEGISDISINEDMVRDMLSGTDPNKSTIPECIHPRILKECSSSLAPGLLLIYNKSLATGIENLVVLNV